MQTPVHATGEHDARRSWPGRSMLAANLAGSIASMAFGAAIVLASGGYAMRVDNLPGPGLYPRVVGLAILVLSSIWLAQTLRGRYRPEADTVAAPTRSALTRGALTLLVLGGVAFALVPMGYPLTAFAAVTAFVGLARGSRRAALATGLAFAVLSHLLVTSGLGIPLPLGLLEPLL